MPRRSQEAARRDGSLADSHDLQVAAEYVARVMEVANVRREQLGLTYRELAEKLGMDHGTLYRILSGQSKAPSADYFVLIVMWASERPITVEVKGGDGVREPDRT